MTKNEFMIKLQEALENDLDASAVRDNVCLLYTSQDYVMQNEKTGQFLNKLTDMISFLIPNYIAEGKTQLVIAIGCTGGKHRSVTIANALYGALEQSEGDYGVKIEHRDIAVSYTHLDVYKRQQPMMP